MECLSGVDIQRVPLSDVSAEYPVLKDWFFTRKHTSAQILGHDRLKSAEERLIYWSSKSETGDIRRQLKDSYKIIPTVWKVPFTVMFACYPEYIVSPEIIRFAKLLNRRVVDEEVVKRVVNKHHTLGNLRLSHSLIYVSRDPIDSEMVYVIRNYPGYQLTLAGQCKVAHFLPKKFRF